MPDRDTYLIYKLINSEISPPLHTENIFFTVIKPTISNVLSYTKTYFPLLVWWIFHHCGLFYNKYFFMIGYFENNQLVHRSCVFPGYYKFPFMNREDLQIGEIWTRDDYKNKGIASGAIKYILSLTSHKNKTFWYIVRENNLESISLAERCGFKSCYVGNKKNKLGISFLGRYEISLNIKS